MGEKWPINDDALFSYIGITDRKTSSFKLLIEEICDYVYGRKIKLDARFEIKEWLEHLLERELFLSITKKRHRDHLLHACRIALLGERILMGKITYDGDKEFRLLDLVRELLKKQEDTQKLLDIYEVDTADNEALDGKILQVWYIAALFHDVGFIYEAFTEAWRNLQVLIQFPNFKEMYLDVEKVLLNFKKGFSVSEVRAEHKSEFTREFDHSKIGACLISNLLSESNLICDMAAFITDHHSSNETLEFSKRPLSFLLVLLDEIQEWQRPVLGRKIHDQILSEKISNLSPFIEYPKVDPELESISLSSDSKVDFEIKMENGKLNLGFILDYGDKASVLEKTNFSYPLMLYLKYKDLQRLRIDKREIREEAKKVLDEALEKALIKVTTLFTIDSKKSHIEALNRENISEELMRELKEKNYVLEKPKVWIIHIGREWKVVDHDKKYSIQKENDKLIIKEIEKCLDKPDLLFNFSIFLDFIANDAVTKQWHRQCDILLLETLGKRNNIISDWLDNIIDYRRNDVVKFEIGNIPRILMGDFKEVITKSHESYVRDKNISENVFNIECRYKISNNDKIKWATKVKRELKNNAPDIPIDRITASFDEDILYCDLKEVKEGDEIITPDVRRLLSLLPKKEPEKGKYEEKFVMVIPLKSFISDKKIGYEIEFSLSNKVLTKDRFDSIYNIRSKYDIKRGVICVLWEKELFDRYFETDCLFFQGEGGKREVIQNRIRERGLDNLDGELDSLRRDILNDDEIVEVLHLKVEEDSYYVKQSVTNVRPYHMAGFLWIHKRQF